MKKIYILLFSILPLLSMAQGSINFDDDTKWTQGAASYTSYSNHSYVDGNFTLTCLDVIRNGITNQDGFAGGFGTYSLRLQNDATTSITMIIATGGAGNFSFQARRWDGTPATNFLVETTTDNGMTWTLSSTIDATVTNDSDWKTISGIINSTNANVGVRIVSNGTTERIMVDNFSWTVPTTNPGLVISSPSNGTVYNPSTTAVNVVFSVSNFTVASGGAGNGYIKYSVNSGTSIDKFDTTPIALAGLTPGLYSVVIDLVDNSGNSLSPSVSRTVNFEIADYINVSNIAALRADVTANGLGRFYNLTGEAFVTYARTSRNQKYIQDASAAVLIDDVPGTISNVFVIGDGMIGLRAQTSAFAGLLQLNPLANVTVSSSGNTITPQVVTAALISANIENYESELVQINGATFTGADGILTFAANNNFTLNDGSDIVFRTMFSEANYIDQIVPTGAANRVVLVGRNNAVVQVTARDLADVTLSTSSFNAIEGLKMYPNPLTGTTLNISSAANANMSVQIFDILGKEVLSTKVVNNTVNASRLNAGIYIVKITEEGNTATRKLVVR